MKKYLIVQDGTFLYYANDRITRTFNDRREAMDYLAAKTHAKKSNPDPIKNVINIFTRERRTFAKQYPHVADAKLVILDAHHTAGSPGKKRDVACVDLSQKIIYLVRRALAFNNRQITGLIRHEFGHLADETPDAPGAEKRADKIAEEVTGKPIHYDGDDIQTTGRGLSRPTYLHK